MSAPRPRALGVRPSGPSLRRRQAVRLLLAVVVLALLPVAAVAGPASAGTDPEQQLAQKYAPVVRLVHQAKQCGPGEPFHPSNVDLLFGNPGVALRGPWTTHDLIKVAPTAQDVAHPLYGYALDLPGNPLKPGCDYQKWFERVWAGSPMTVYSHVATQADRPGKLALQYWLYYPFNDFNNKHESDWEMVQVEFDAATAAEALTRTPTRTVYSAHEGSEQADWGSSKLQLVDATHPTVFVSSGSHSNHYESALFLLRSSHQGLGCDTTLDPEPGVEPVVQTIPSEPRAAATLFPWTRYQGGWGQAEARSFYNGPTGPEAKGSWDHPFTWSQDAGLRSYNVPGGQVYGLKTTDFFCGVISQGSMALLAFTANPWPVLAILAAVLIVLGWLIRRTSWGTAREFPVRRRRDFGETVVSVWLAYRRAPLVFLGIGLVVAAAGVVSGLVRQLVTQAPVLAETAPQPHGWGAVVATAGVLLTGLTSLISNAATVQTLSDLDRGERVTIARAYRKALRRGFPLVGSLLFYVILGVVLLLRVWLLPLVAVLLVLATALFPVTQLEKHWGPMAMWRSAKLVRHQWLKVFLLILFGLLLTLLAGGLLGSALVLAYQVPFILVNLVPGIVIALLGPVLSLLGGYIYFHGIAREEESGTAEPEPEAEDSETALV
jgi:hypothetical protein